MKLRCFANANQQKKINELEMNAMTSQKSTNEPQGEILEKI